MNSALAYLHGEEVTHRDVKLANILISSKNPHFDFKLADFSDSSSSPELTTFCGTPAYQALEVKDGSYSKVVDIWSLGVVLIERWCPWYPDFIYNLSISRRDTFLPDMWRNTEVADNTRKREARERLPWTDTLRERWINFVRSRLQKETDNAMPKLFLNMFEVDPRKRWSARYCYHYLQLLEIKHSYESRGDMEVSEPQQSQDLNVSTHRPSKKTKLSDNRMGNPRPTRPVDNRREAFVKVHFRPFQRMMSVTDLWHASGKRNWPQRVICCRYQCSLTNKHRYISYEDGLDLANRLKLGESSLKLLKSWTLKESTEPFSTAAIRLEKLEKISKTQKIVHIWPLESIINATNIMACGNVSRQYRTHFLKSNQFLNTRILSTPRMQGTYIGYDDGLRLCKLLNLPTKTVKLAMDEGWLGPVLEVRTGELSGVGQHQDSGTKADNSDSQCSDVEGSGDGDSDGSDEASDEGGRVDVQYEHERSDEGDEESDEGSGYQSPSDHENGDQKNANIPRSVYSTPDLRNTPLPEFVPTREAIGDLSASFGFGEGSFPRLESVQEMPETDTEQ